MRANSRFQTLPSADLEPKLPVSMACDVVLLPLTEKGDHKGFSGANAPLLLQLLPPPLLMLLRLLLPPQPLLMLLLPPLKK